MIQQNLHKIIANFWKIIIHNSQNRNVQKSISNLNNWTENASYILELHS